MQYEYFYNIYSLPFCHLTESRALYKKVRQVSRGHDGRVVTFLPPTSEIKIRILALPQVGKVVATYCWSAAYYAEP